MTDIRIPGTKRVVHISLRRRANIERDVGEEIRFHIDARAAELMRLGVPQHDARERAEAEYGDIEESCRELVAVDRRRLTKEHGEEIIMSLVDDIRYATRGWMRRPALLGVATVALALGIAANTIMFGVVDQLLLRFPAHVVAPEQIKRLYFADSGQFGRNVGAVTTYPAIAAIRDLASGFGDLAFYGPKTQWSLGSGPEAKDVSTQLASGNFFRLLGVRPQLGRFFAEGEDRVPQGDLVAVVSDEFWRRELGASADAIGQSIRLQGKQFTIVGVAPPGFVGIDAEDVDVWMPVSAMANELHGQDWHSQPNSWWARVIARTLDDVPLELATEQATAGYQSFIRQFPDLGRSAASSRVLLSGIVPARSPEGYSTESKVALWLTGVSVIVLLISCANVANILIARTLQRRREIAVRLAMGVSRARLLQLLLTEAGIIAVLATFVALALAIAGGRLVQSVLVPSVAWSRNVLDLRALSFTLVVSVACVLLAGLAPALEALSTRVSESLKASSHQPKRRQRLRFGLMTLQAALSVVLLIGAGLFVRSLRNVVSRDVGVDRDRVLRVTMPLSRFGFDAAQAEDIYRRGSERLMSIAGVTHVSTVRRSIPLGSSFAGRFEVPGVAKAPSFQWAGPYEMVVDHKFFPAIGAAILRGRNFTDVEARVATRVLIVNDSVARAYWPNENPIGKCAKVGGDTVCSEVIGVAPQVLQSSLIHDRAMVYLPTAHPILRARPGALIIRTSGNASRLAGTVQRELQRLSEKMPFVTVRSFEELVEPQLQSRRLGATMLTLFGGIALIIAAVGLYSVMAFWVSQRAGEIGVRMALGARRSNLIWLVVWQSTRAVVLGLALGASAAAFASRWVVGILYETSPRDPLVYAVAALVLVIATIVACIVPARRAATVHPALVMQAD